MSSRTKIAKWLEQYYYKTESGTRCSYCGKDYPKVANIYKVVHLYKYHEKTNKEYEKEWKRDTSHFIWKYFTKENAFGAKCNILIPDQCAVPVPCSKLITAGYHKEELYKHILYNHRGIITAAQEEITSSWMSKYFTFQEYSAICKYSQQNCKQKINILAGRQVFEAHLRIEHNKRQPNIRDNNVEMLQQSADEGNIPGPSSRHDNTRSDDSFRLLASTSTLENFIQEDQLRCETGNNNVQMLQQSVDEENVASPSSYLDDIGSVDSCASLSPLVKSIEKYGIYQCEKETSVNTVETIQQSVDEGNNTGPSSHHDNTRSDSLPVLPSITTFKNPFKRKWGDFNYQSEEKRWVYTVKTTQQSVDRGNIDDPSFHHNETSLDDSFRLLPSTSTENFIQENQMRELIEMMGSDFEMHFFEDMSII